MAEKREESLLIVSLICHFERNEMEAKNLIKNKDFSTR